MKHLVSTHLIRSLLSYTLLISTALRAADMPASYFSIRSQGFNTARKYVGITNKINLDQDTVYGTLWSTIDYTRSFRPQRIAQALFGDDILVMNSNCACLQVSGSQASSRGPKDLLADYFGLPVDFKSRVCFRPHFDTMIFDCNMYLGLDEIFKGFYCSVQAPIAHTRWDLSMNEEVISRGIQGYPAGYFGPNPIPVNHLLNSFTEFVSGLHAPTIFDCTVTSTQPRIIFKELNNAKMDNRRHVRTRVAELTFTAGWNFLQDEDEQYHAGFALRTSAPCGNKPKGEFLFEPMVGNGHHWEFGCETNGHYTWLLGDNDNHALSFFGDVTLVHMFKAHQRRTYDLHGKPFSRYMLVQSLDYNSTSTPHLANPPFPALAFANVFTPLANLSTVDVDVSAGLQADCLAMFTYQHGRMTWDLGYNFWGKTCDNIVPICNSSCRLTQAPDPNELFALKGDAYVIGFENGTNSIVRLAATESKATIHSGTNMTVTPPSPWVTNPGIDNRQPATSNNGNVNIPAGGQQTGSSVPPMRVSSKDIQLNDTRTHGSSHKIFTNISYTWDDKQEWLPFVGIGGEAEFGTGNKQLTGSCKRCCKKQCADCPCLNTSVSQWSFWIKGGASF